MMSLSTLLFFLGVILVIWQVIRKIVRVWLLRNFENKVSQILPIADKQLEVLDDLFVPNRHVTDEDIEMFAKDNEETRNTIGDFYNDKHDFLIEYLDSTSIKPYYEQTTENELKKRQKDNNAIVDNIEQLKRLSSKVTEAYKKLMDDDNYLTFSEMDYFNLSVKEVETLSKTLIPKYEKYIGEEVKNNLNLYRKIESERKRHNEAFIQRELTAQKAYFDTVLGKYPLDSQQRDSIVKLEDNCLVIASAGSGKTSTIVAKAKYLVECRKIKPEKILLITYTRKAAEELKDRMKIDGLECSTFHGLAYKILSQVNNRVPSICEASLPQAVFYRLMQTDKRFLMAINHYILDLQSLQKLEHEYDDAFSYFEDRKKYGIQALLPDMDGNIVYTKSEEEKRICTILSKYGVRFRYEQPYEHNTFTNEYRQYKPDFTIYWTADNEEKHLYLEHFAIDSLEQVPKWFGDGREGGWYKANRIYNEGISWKRQIHAEHKTILIETKSADFHSGDVEQKLLSQLQKYGVPIQMRNDEEIYNLLVKRNKKLEKTVFTLILSFITLLKANEKNIDELIKKTDNTDITLLNIVTVNQRSHAILCDIMRPFLNKYQEALDARGEIDFTDCIIKATDLCRKGLWKNYDYILVDEFQDISVDRYKFLQSLRTPLPLTKLFCVGDDWQSIYRFAGSDMSLFYEFEEYFGYTEQCKIETTYRFHQPLISKTSEFIQKNPQQKPKTISTPKGDHLSTNLTFVTCEDKDDVLNQVEKIVKIIPASETIMLMGRYNYDAYSVGYKDQMGNNESTVSVNISGRRIRFLSVHSAKGLEADHVILVNCNQGAYGFPSLIEDDPILDFVLSKAESYPYAEERRLFYVALTRAKKMAYVLYDQHKPSPFVSEFQPRLTQGDYLCPTCMDGKVVIQKQGVANNGTPFTVYSCSNHDAGCTFFERKFGEHEHPGTLINDTTTAQDIEIWRDGQRRTNRPVLTEAAKKRLGFLS